MEKVGLQHPVSVLSFLLMFSLCPFLPSRFFRLSTHIRALFAARITSFRTYVNPTLLPEVLERVKILSLCRGAHIHTHTHTNRGPGTLSCRYFSDLVPTLSKRGNVIMVTAAEHDSRLSTCPNAREIQWNFLSFFLLILGEKREAKREKPTP